MVGFTNMTYTLPPEGSDIIYTDVPSYKTADTLYMEDVEIPGEPPEKKPFPWWILLLLTAGYMYTQNQ